MTEKKIMTVLGPVEPSKLGITSMHDHILFDSSILGVRLRAKLPKDAMPLSNLPLHEDDKVTLENVGLLRRNARLAWDALKLDDEAMACQEVADFKALGGDAIVEMSVPGWELDKTAERRISEQTGVHIIVSTGFYTGDTWPAAHKGKSAEELYEHMMQEVRLGVLGGGVLPGHIKIAIEYMSEDEENALRAAVRVANETGLALTIHPCKKLGMDGAHHLKILRQEGMDLTRVVMAHTRLVEVPPLAEALKHPERHRVNLDEAHAFLDAGCNISVEFFNTELLSDYDAGDLAKMSGFVKLVEQGYCQQMVTGNDCCAKIALRRSGGGGGYSKMLYYTLPMLKNGAGLSDYALRQIFIENPRRILAY